jgi:hypothetical protein
MAAARGIMTPTIAVMRAAAAYEAIGPAPSAPADRLCKQPQGSAVLQDLIVKGVHRRLGIFGVKLCDNHHTLPPFFFIALPPVFGPLLRALLSSHLHESLKGPTGGRAYWHRRYQLV